MANFNRSFWFSTVFETEVEINKKSSIPTPNLEEILPRLCCLGETRFAVEKNILNKFWPKSRRFWAPNPWQTFFKDSFFSKFLKNETIRTYLRQNWDVSHYCEKSSKAQSETNTRNKWDLVKTRKRKNWFNFFLSGKRRFEKDEGRYTGKCTGRVKTRMKKQKTDFEKCWILIPRVKLVTQTMILGWESKCGITRHGR